jgi:acetoin utilization protein AcuB
MLVGMWMSRDLVTVTPTTPIAAAAAAMARHRVRRLLVVEATGQGPRLAGLVSLLDVARAYPADVNPLSASAGERGPRRPVSSIMARHLHTVAPDTPIEDAARALLEHKIGALPVLRDGHPVGIITESDIFRALVEAVGGGTPGVRVTFDLARGEEAADLVIDLARHHGLRVVCALSVEREGQRLGVVRVAGGEREGFVQDIWRTGHRVLSVIRT